MVLQNTIKIPEDVQPIADMLIQAGADVYVVGGYVRDSLLGLIPSDCDLATNMTPDVVMATIATSTTRYTVVPTGIEYGTVTVFEKGARGKGVEITTFRTDGVYCDGRRPTAVCFAQTIEEDLQRRDFAINAIAWNVKTGYLIDPCGGKDDLNAQIVTCVGDPNQRFREDALRMLRAIRFAATHKLSIKKDTLAAIIENASLISNVSKERVRDELLKILVAPAVAQGLEYLLSTGLLRYIIPALIAQDCYPQDNSHHKYTLWGHTVRVVESCPPRAEMRLAALLHDIAKPICKVFDAAGVAHYYKHDIVGAKIAEEVCSTLKLSKEQREYVVELVKHHMLMLDGMASDKTLRRYIAKFGAKLFIDLLQLQMADLIGTGTRFESSVRKETKELITRAIRLELDTPVYMYDLAINGKDVMKLTGIPQGPLVGMTLRYLHDTVIDEPSRNTKECLTELAQIYVNAIDECAK